MPQLPTPPKPSSEGSSPPVRRSEVVTERIPTNLPWKLMLFSLVLFALSIFIFFGLRYGYNNFLDGQIAEVDARMNELAQQVGREEQERFLDFYSQLVNLERVLKNRNFSQNTLNFLEEKTLPAVYYTNLEYSARDLSVKLIGNAESMRSFVQQLKVFDDAVELERVMLDSLTQEGGVVFGVELVFKKEAFNTIKNNQS